MNKYLFQQNVFQSIKIHLIKKKKLQIQHVLKKAHKQKLVNLKKNDI